MESSADTTLASGIRVRYGYPYATQTNLKEALDLVKSAYLDGRFSYLEWVSTRQEFLDTRLTLIEAASQVHLSKTEIETLTGLALKAPQSGTSKTDTAKNNASKKLEHNITMQQPSNISIRSNDYE